MHTKFSYTHACPIALQVHVYTVVDVLVHFCSYMGAYVRNIIRELSMRVRKIVWAWSGRSFTTSNQSNCEGSISTDSHYMTCIAVAINTLATVDLHNYYVHTIVCVLKTMINVFYDMQFTSYRYHTCYNFFVCVLLTHSHRFIID